MTARKWNQVRAGRGMVDTLNARILLSKVTL